MLTFAYLLIAVAWPLSLVFVYRAGYDHGGRNSAKAFFDEANKLAHARSSETTHVRRVPRPMVADAPD